METPNGNSREDRLQAFVDWTHQHITGDEKGEAQLFLDHLLQAFHQPELLETGKAEFRIKKSPRMGAARRSVRF